VTFPLVNATVTNVTAPTAEDYDTPAGAGTTVWSGSERAYVIEQLVEVPGNDRLDVLRKTEIVIPSDIGRLVQAEHSVTYTYDGSTHIRKVQSTSVHAMLGRARLALEDE
jgi:hypothetical protein